MKAYNFVHEGVKGCAVQYINGEVFIHWRGIGFQLKAARPELKAAIFRQTGIY